MNKINVDGIPDELKIFKQWVCWRYEQPDPNKKKTKVPYSPTTNRRASVMDRFTWVTFNEAVAGLDRFDGIGFVLTKEDPYCVMDLDATTNEEDYAKLCNYYTRLNSFTEISPSGTGSHIWLKAEIGKGRNKRPFELYSQQRFVTVTGNVHYATQICQRQDVATDIWNELAPEGGDRFIHYDGTDPAAFDDQTVLNKAAAAKNGYKFCQLWAGAFTEWYASQSEADFALMDILAYYTQNAEQLARLFRFSQLGQRDKAKRDDYVLDMITKSFDKLPPKANIEAVAASVATMIEQFKKEQDDMILRPMPTDGTTGIPPTEKNYDDDVQETVIEVAKPATPSYVNSDMATLIESPIYFPEGLVGDVAEYIYRSSPRPVKEIALAASMGLLAGITGSAYNISSAGLNMYILALAPTGTGKESLGGGISKLMANVRAVVPSADKFVGASHIASPQALLGYLSKQSRSCVSIIGECGLWLRDLSDPRAPANVSGLRRTMLDLYGKSGRGSTVQPSIYADSAKNTEIIRQPAFSLLGESTLTRFYEIIDESLISEGFIPRWLIVEYNGRRPPLNENHASVLAPTKLLQGLANLVENCHRMMETLGIIDIGYANANVEEDVKEFNRYCDAQINSSSEEAVKNLWTRAYLKALKLAGLCAVGRNFGTPLVNEEDWRFAKMMVLKDTVKMCRSFSAGTLTALVSSETQDQYNCVIRVLKQYVAGGQSPVSTDASYGISENMRRDFAVPYSLMQRKLNSNRAFAKSKIGSSRALQNTLRDLELAGVLMKLTPQQTMTEYEYQGALWVISDITALTRMPSSL